MCRKSKKYRVISLKQLPDWTLTIPPTNSSNYTIYNYHSCPLLLQPIAKQFDSYVMAKDNNYLYP